MEIRPLVPERVEDYLEFFDHRAFPDNPAWQSCYCNCLFADETIKPWPDYTLAENRAEVRARIVRGKMPGFLAYGPDGPIGWLGAGPKRDYPVFAGLAEAELEGIGSITCFLVAPSARGQGVARAMLGAALTAFRSAGLHVAEAYPRPKALTAAAMHYGPMGLFLAEGFSLFAEDRDGSVTVRRSL